MDPCSSFCLGRVSLGDAGLGPMKLLFGREKLKELVEPWKSSFSLGLETGLR